MFVLSSAMLLIFDAMVLPMSGTTPVRPCTVNNSKKKKERKKKKKKNFTSLNDVLNEYSIWSLIANARRCAALHQVWREESP